MARKSWNKGKGAAIAWLRAHVEHQGDDCLIWPFSRNPVSGYGYFSYNGEGPRRAHRFMCELAHGAPPTPAHEAAHSCGKGHEGCIHPCHLSWKTHAENQRDRARHGTAKRESRRGRWKLTPEQVAEIRSSSDSVTVLAARYSVTEPNIRLILRRQTWKTDGYTPIGFAVTPYRGGRPHSVRQR